MGITAVCDSCGKKFQAPDRMAGKRVKCRGCGNAFTLPGGEAEVGVAGGDGEDTRFGGEAGTSAGRESGIFGEEGGSGEEAAPMEASFTKRSRPVSSAPGEDDSEEGRAFRRRSDWYRNPLVKQLDRWIPPGASVLGLLWLLVSTYFASDGLPIWVFGLRMAVIVVCYVAVIAPLAYVGIRYSISSAGGREPSDGRWRAFTAYMPAVTLGVVIWNVGAGGTPALIMGTLLGLAISAGALMVLFRLEPDEIGPAALYASGAFVFGAFICGMAIWGLNLGMMKGIGDKISGIENGPNSPLWSYMSWDVAKPVAATSTTKPKTATKPIATTPNGPTLPGTTTPPPGTTGADPTFVQPLPDLTKIRPGELVKLTERQETISLEGRFETVIWPKSVSTRGVVIRKNSDQLQMEAWDAAAWTKGDGTFTLKAQTANTPLENLVSLSADGKKLAYFFSFPKPSIQFHYFEDGRDEKITEVDKDGNATFVGFLNDKRLMFLQDDSAGSTTLVWLDEKTKAKPVDLQVKVSRANGIGTTFAISPTGQMAAVIGRNASGEHKVAIYNLKRETPSPLDHNINMDKDLAIAPSGMAFSPDGSQIAIYYEWGGSAVLLVHDAMTGAQLKEFIFPASPLPPQDHKNQVGSAINWFPDGRAFLLFGDAVVDAITGKPIGRLGVQGVASARFSADDQVDLMVDDPNRKLVRVKINSRWMQELIAIANGTKPSTPPVSPK